MSAIVFAFPGNEMLARQITTAIHAEEGVAYFRYFPDGESFVRVDSDVAGKQVVVVATLDYPDSKILSLLYLCKKLNADGAAFVTLVAPYLAYMRQDKAFHTGEVVTSKYFASLLSSFADRLITIDPHLHRYHSLSEIYSIPCTVLHATSLISKWIKENIDNPVLIGPDVESKQWVSKVAKEVHAPFVVLHKQRLGDHTVKVTVPDVEKYKSHTPVLLDDIISTARTMMEALKHVQAAKLKPAVCIGVHAVFTAGAYQQLINKGGHSVITCNTIPHASNQIDVSNLIIQSLRVPKVLGHNNDNSHSGL